MNDLRFSLRMLRKNPAFTAVAVLVLALGSGANTAIFSILNAVVLRPLPYSDPGQLYSIGSITSRGPRGVSAADFESWRERTRVFEKMTAAWSEQFILSGVDEPEQLFGLSVTPDCFEMLGVPPQGGRWLNPEDFKAGAVWSVVLGYELWQRHFHGDRSLIGKPILLDGKSRTVVGIMPPLFQFNHRKAEFWVPLTFSPRLLSLRELCIYQVFARAKEGVSRQEVAAEAHSVRYHPQRGWPEEAPRRGA